MAKCKTKRIYKNKFGCSPDEYDKLYRDEYAKKHRDYFKKKSKDKRKQFPDDSREAVRQWRLKNKEKIKAYTAQYYKDNKERQIEKSRAYYHANKDHCSERMKKWTKKNLINKRVNQNRRRGKIKSIGGSHTKQDVFKISERQNYKCVYCERSIKQKYHVDHKKPLSRGGGNSNRNIQILCPSCNLSKKDKSHKQLLKEISL